MLCNLVACKSDLKTLAEIVSDSNFYLLVGETTSVKQVSSNVEGAKFGPPYFVLHLTASKQKLQDFPIPGLS